MVGGRHHLQGSLVGHACALELLIALHVRHPDVDRLLLALRLACSFSRAAAKSLRVVFGSVRPCDTTPVRRQQCMSTTARTRRRASPRVAFRTHESVLFGLEGGFTGSAHLTPHRFPFVFRLMSPFCVGVGLNAGASGESSVVNGPSPG